MTNPTSQPRTSRLYHAAALAAFPPLTALALAFSAIATMLVARSVAAQLGLALPVSLAIGQLALASVAVAAVGVARQPPAVVGIVRPSLRAVAAAVLIGATAWYPHVRLVSLLELRDDGGLARITELSLPVALLVVSLLPGVCEELVFRGLILRGLLSRSSAVVALAVSAAMFALYHAANPVQIVPNLLLGVELGVVTLACGSAIPAMIAHALNNAVVLTVLAGAVPALYDPIANRGALEDQPTLVLLVAASATVAGLVLVWMGRRGDSQVVR